MKGYSITLCYNINNNLGLLIAQDCTGQSFQGCLHSGKPLKTERCLPLEQRASMFTSYDKRFQFVTFRIPLVTQHTVCAGVTCPFPLSPSRDRGSRYKYEKMLFWLLLLPWVTKFFVSDPGSLVFCQHRWNRNSLTCWFVSRIKSQTLTVVETWISILPWKLGGLLTSSLHSHIPAFP